MMEVIHNEKERQENTPKRDEVIAEWAFIAATRFGFQIETPDAGTLHRRRPKDLSR
jgi:hypothetical protein